ncbi:hypothetical protein D4R89_12985 [bacterium]|nr:MAG: hypothetical protein D4R89_12985 [bacterium]
MKTPTETEFQHVFRLLETAQGALVGMVNFLLAEKRPTADKGNLTDTEKYELLSFFHCPDCHGKSFLKGPEGGCSVNIKCVDCESRFNICPPYFAERI